MNENQAGSLDLHFYHQFIPKTWVSQVSQMVKNLPAVQETGVPSLGWEDPLEKGMGTHSSILAWRILWTESGGLQSMESQRVRHDWATNTHTHTHTPKTCSEQAWCCGDLTHELFKELRAPSRKKVRKKMILVLSGHLGMDTKLQILRGYL